MTYLDKPSNWNTMTKSDKKNFYKRSAKFNNYNTADEEVSGTGWAICIVLMGIFMFGLYSWQLSL